MKNMNEAIVPDIYEPSRLDRIVQVEDRPAYATATQLALEEALFVVPQDVPIRIGLHEAGEVGEGVEPLHRDPVEAVGVDLVEVEG